MGRIKYQPAIPALLNVLAEKGEEKSDLRKYAADALWQLRAFSAQEVMQQALLQATSIDERATIYLVSELLAGKLTQSELTAQRILELLEVPREDFLPLLAHIERTADIEELVLALKQAATVFTRISLCYRIGQRMDAFAVPTLLEILQDNNEQVRYEAAQALMKIKSSTSGEAILKALEHEQNIQVRCQLIEALGTTKQNTAIPLLIQDLSDPNEYIRASSAWALGEMNAQNAKKALRALISQETANWALEKMSMALKALELF